MVNLFMPTQSELLERVEELETSNKDLYFENLSFRKEINELKSLVQQLKISRMSFSKFERMIIE